MTLSAALRAILLAVPLLASPLAAGTGRAAETLDPQTGLVVAPGWKAVRANCVACHSAKLVTQNRGSANTWRGLIRWMQETQGLWELAPGVEAEILDYLAEHYGPRTDARRAPLDKRLLPPNPYRSPDSAPTGEAGG